MSIFVDLIILTEYIEGQKFTAISDEDMFPLKEMIENKIDFFVRLALLSVEVLKLFELW